MHQRTLVLLCPSVHVAMPGYISCSVAGSYDNKGIAIFALMVTYFLWVKYRLPLPSSLLSLCTVVTDPPCLAALQQREAQPS